MIDKILTTIDNVDNIEKILTTIETMHDFSHFMYMMKFVACETLNLVNVLGQMYFMDR